MKIFHIWFLLTRPMTLGARMAAIDADGKVLLVKHTYVPGWHLPGGGVDNGETSIEAAVRELEEETGLVPETQPSLFALYFNNSATRRDHVAVYRCKVSSNALVQAPDKEIADARFFSLDALPQDVSAGTHRRLAELFEGAEISPYW